ncbi:MAG: transcription factor, partial [Desulfuromonadales bacterium]|nr:transcription factor [Desulfuromonadales bacterium]NIR34285.1 transcription factor [Desulfuromonadales bacterium]NIS42863.1 transcription factor [Desulfuromonadales bacterium]
LVDNCDKTRHTPVTVSGRHFVPGSRVLLDGAAVASEQQNGQLVFKLPQTLDGGQHEVVVVNPDRKTSLAEALQVETQPEIYSVSQGADRVNSYEVVITGRNFLYSSTLVVNGRQINNLPLEAASPPQSDHVRYIDCETLIYVRYPYSRELHDV